jgi:ribosomal protein S18 acetylase RimI-like enzyme
MKPHIELKHACQSEDLGMIKELFIEYAQSLEIDLGFQGFANELESLPGKYAPPDGSLVLALVDGQAAGCIALRPISFSICEMKRLYVRPAYRGLDLGKKLINAMIAAGQNLNYQYVRLDTLSSMQPAIHLYESLGFYEIAQYIYNPIPGARFFELQL